MAVRERSLLRLRRWPVLAAFVLLATAGLAMPASSAFAAAYPPAAGCAASYLPSDGSMGTVTGSGFTAGTHISLQVGSVSVGSATADPQGGFSKQVALGSTAGTMSAVSADCTVTAVDSTTSAVSPQTQVSATGQAQAAGHGVLASTGAKIGLPLALGALLVAIGSVLARVARRRAG